jgi:hypothetical protein
LAFSASEKLEPRNLEGNQGHARNHHVAVRRLQKPQLHDDEEQEEALRARGNEKVLQFVPQAHAAQRG